VLVEQQGNMTKTAHALGMWRSQLYHIIRHDKELTRIWRTGMLKLKRKQGKKSPARILEIVPMSSSSRKANKRRPRKIRPKQTRIWDTKCSVCGETIWFRRRDGTPREHSCPHGRSCIAANPRRRALGCPQCLRAPGDRSENESSLRIPRCTKVLVRQTGVKMRCGLAVGHPDEHKFTERL
jgi:hypothetical protein